MIKQYINEDFFWKNYQSLDKDTREEFKHLLMSIGSSANDFADNGKLSKITGHRIYEGCHHLYAEAKPSEWQLRLWTKGYEIHFVRMDWFKKALKKFWEVSKEEKNITLIKHIRFWEDIREKKMVRLEKEKQKEIGEEKQDE